MLLGAGREFAEHGYDGATISLILSHIGISTGAAYYYFDNKADLFRAVVEFHADRFVEQCGTRSDVDDVEMFWKRWDGLLQFVLGRGAELHGVLGALRTTWKHSRELRDDTELARAFARAEAINLDLIRRGCELGAIRDDVPPALLMRCMRAFDEAFDEWVAEQPAEFGREQILKLAAHMAGLLRRLLRAPRPGEPLC
jgi:AcrR family transcriptional regulator